MRFTPTNRTPRDFLTGFLTFANGKPIVHGRPCGLLRLGPDTFLLSDDFLGLIYYIHPKADSRGVDSRQYERISLLSTCLLSTVLH